MLEVILCSLLAWEAGINLSKLINTVSYIYWAWRAIADLRKGLIPQSGHPLYQLAYINNFSYYKVSGDA